MFICSATLHGTGRGCSGCGKGFSSLLVIVGVTDVRGNRVAVSQSTQHTQGGALPRRPTTPFPGVTMQTRSHNKYLPVECIDLLQS